MQRLEVSGAVRPIYTSLGFKGLMLSASYLMGTENFFPLVERPRRKIYRSPSCGSWRGEGQLYFLCLLFELVHA